MTIYHIIDSQTWNNTKDSKKYSPPSLNKEKFIHASKKEQVLPTANRRYQDRDNLLLLAIDSTKVKPLIKFEYSSGAKEDHPHIYGSLNLDAIINVLKFKKNEAGVFEKFPEEKIDDRNILRTSLFHFFWFVYYSSKTK
jgi:uncharacterized protein (DUF952 family)